MNGCLGVCCVGDVDAGDNSATVAGAQKMPSQGASAKERRLAKLQKQLQQLKQEVAGKERQQQKQKRWQCDRYEALERQEYCGLECK